MKNKTIKSFMALVVMVMAFAVTGITAKAATVTNLKQTGDGTTSVTVQWTGVEGVKYYGIQVAKDKAFTDIATTEYVYGSASSDYISGLITGTTYWLRIGYGPDSKSCFANFSAPIEVVTTPASMTEVKFVGADNTTASIAWDAVAGANYYEVENGKTKQKYQVTTNSCKLPIDNNVSNWVKVTPYRLCASTGYKAMREFDYKTNYDITRLTTKISKSNFGMVRAWASINCFDFGVNANGHGWEIQGQTVSGKKYTFKGSRQGIASTISIDRKMKKNKMYKYRVRAYITTTDGKQIFGSWSDYQYIVNPDGKYSQASGKKIKLNWKKCSGVSKIKVQVSTKEKSGYKTCATLKGTKTSYTITKYGKSKLKKNKRYYFRVLFIDKKGKTTPIRLQGNTKIYR